MFEGRIIFVGLHNKPHMSPLDSHTKTGKLIDRIINELPNNIEILKTNLFDVDYMPDAFESNELATEWYLTHFPNEEDVIILLGAMVHNKFKKCYGEIIKVAHPASKRSHIQMDEYVSTTAGKIMKAILCKT